MIKIQRLSEQPILGPRKDHPWEAGAVFNCAAIYHNGTVHLLYRATDRSSNGKDGPYINSLGYAVSNDGVNFTRRVEPVLVNDVLQELRGPEDPRIVELDGRFYMMYTGFGGRFDGDYRICLATSSNLIDWKRHGVMLDEPNKDASLFPTKIGGSYLMFHRRPPDIWLAYSKDLKSWTDHSKVAGPIENSHWENLKIGICGPPIKTKAGWFLIYHGVNEDRKYSLGAMLLDLDDPRKVLARQAEPILEPELSWEINGYVPNVVFSCGQVILDNRILVYYGGADTVIGVGTLDIQEISQNF
jgi:predicted GH43/DUF377 family glycosyl hydrolase